MEYIIRNHLQMFFSNNIWSLYITEIIYHCCRDLTKVTSNHREHQQFQYKLIGTILTWHQMFTNYTFKRLQKSGILALYQSYKQTQQLFNKKNTPPANSQKNVMPASPQPKSNQLDEKQQNQLDLEVCRAMPIDSAANQSQPRPRSQSAGKKVSQIVVKQENGIKIEQLLYRDGTVKLEYTEKFQNEVNALIVRYLKPTREILSRQKINLADKKLQKYLEILQLIQQRLVKVISEVKNEESVVSLANKPLCINPFNNGEDDLYMNVTAIIKIDNRKKANSHE